MARHCFLCGAAAEFKNSYFGIRPSYLFLLCPSSDAGVTEEEAQHTGIEDTLGRSRSSGDDARGPQLSIERVHALFSKLRVLIEDVS